jgi:hypothetical protein
MIIILGTACSVCIILGFILIKVARLFPYYSSAEQAFKGPASAMLGGSIPSGLLALVLSDGGLNGAISVFFVASATFAAIGALIGAIRKPFP